MDERIEREGDLFRRYELRIVQLELACEVFHEFCEKYRPIVDQMTEDARVALRVAAALQDARRVKLSRVQILLAIAALAVPSIVSAFLTSYLMHR